ncbi:hypothetical protein [Coleofasciculus sp. H7-2]|uniref:hypothetical protein n=1 Tax=Coleofasciculus sp. H7-2 TaxID=3351545 RepID=UPI00367246F8
MTSGLTQHHHIVRATTRGLNRQERYMYKLCVSPDFIRKPIYFDELMARIQASLRLKGIVNSAQ